MAGIVEVAKIAGLNPAKCPHCGRSIRTGSRVFHRLFRAILEHVHSGEEVSVPGFGIFRRVVRSACLKPRGAVNVVGKEVFDASGQEAVTMIRMTFKQSRVARIFLNKEEQ